MRNERRSEALEDAKVRTLSPCGQSDNNDRQSHLPQMAPMDS